MINVTNIVNINKGENWKQNPETQKIYPVHERHGEPIQKCTSLLLFLQKEMLNFLHNKTEGTTEEYQL